MPFAETEVEKEGSTRNRGSFNRGTRRYIPDLPGREESGGSLVKGERGDRIVHLSVLPGEFPVKGLVSSGQELVDLFLPRLPLKIIFLSFQGLVL